ncbi:MAG: hypothetical protein ACREC6_04390 [Hyphomicrobiaceae bacterium]
MPANESNTLPMPKSLEGHDVPQERLDLIRPHVAALSATALQVSDTLPLSADVADFVRTLEAEKEAR